MKKLIEKYKEMYSLTKQKCDHARNNKGCFLNGCCSSEYCQMAEERAKEFNVTLTPTKNRFKFLDENGVCVVPPHIRVLCTIHVCDKLFFGDSEFYEKYFKLRDELEELEDKLIEKKGKL